MKSAKIFLFLLMTMSSLITKAEDSTSVEIMTIKNFVKDVSNDNITFDYIIQKYLCVESEGRDESVKLIEQALLDFRRQLQSSFPWELENYLHIPPEEQLVMAANETKPHIYRLKFLKKSIPPVFIRIRNGKIISFVAMQQGNRRIFIKFCQ